jgi:hypothetical protein
MNDITNVKNAMSVELEYFYSLDPKTKSFYNFTQPSKIRLWWFQSNETYKQFFS